MEGKKKEKTKVGTWWTVHIILNGEIVTHFWRYLRREIADREVQKCQEDGFYSWARDHSGIIPETGILN